MDRRIFVATTILSVLLIVFSAILLFTNQVDSFSMFERSSDCTPYNVFVSRGDKEYSAEISWYTKGKCLGYVRYGLDVNNMENISIDISEKSQSRYHRVIMEKLLTNETYYYLIKSGEKSYGNNNTPLEFVLEKL